MLPVKKPSFQMFMREEEVNITSYGREYRWKTYELGRDYLYSKFDNFKKFSILAKILIVPLVFVMSGSVAFERFF